MSSAAPASSGGSKAKKVLRYTLVGLVLGLVWIWYLGPEVMEAYRPPALAGVRVAVAEGNQMVVAHAAAMQTKLDTDQAWQDEDGSVDLDKWKQSRFPIGNEIHDASNARDAFINRATGRSTAMPRYETDPHKPWADCVPFYETMEVKATGYVTNLWRPIRSGTTPLFVVPVDGPYEQVGPDGTMGVEQAKGYALPVPDDNHYLAFIGRVADRQTGAALTSPFFIGARAILDPTVIGATGCLQTAVNQNPYLAGADEKFRYSFQPVANYK